MGILWEWLLARPISLRTQIIRNFVLWVVMIPLITVIVSPIGDDPLPDGQGWRRAALFALPFVLAGAVLDAYSERSRSRRWRALGSGFAIALVMFAMLNVDRAAEGITAWQIGKGLLALPLMAVFMSLPRWTSETYLEPRTDAESSSK